MSKNRFLRSVFFRMGLKVLAWEAVLVAVTWLLSKRVSGLQGHPFSDGLFIVGTLALIVASTGMMGSPYAVGPAVGMGLTVQPTERERREQQLAEFVQKRSFALPLASSGLLTILVSLFLTFVINK